MADFRFGKSNMADVRFGKIEHAQFSVFGNPTWPIFDFGKSNMADFRFSVIEHGRFSIFGCRTLLNHVLDDSEIDSSGAKSCNSLSEINSAIIIQFRFFLVVKGR